VNRRQKKKKTTRRKSPQRKAGTVSAYLAGLARDQRAALQNLRANIKAAAPDLEECISYGIPAFRWQGKFLLGLGAARDHCSFYPGSVIQDPDVKDALRNYDLSKGTIRFTPDRPLPKSLVRRLVRRRVAERQA
jgi:uncharacterized protein YdhG (YjbR/CyaY superfamily)